jgi:hypothetical protein
MTNRGLVNAEAINIAVPVIISLSAGAMRSLLSAATMSRPKGMLSIMRWSRTEKQRGQGEGFQSTLLKRSILLLFPELPPTLSYYLFLCWR